MTSSQISVLIVEDELIVAHSLQARLERHGYRVIALARSGDDAIAAVSRSRPDLILMDIRIAGDIDGIAVAERIRAEHDVPVIFLTAYSDDETLARAKITEPFGYIIKPFETRELINNIEIAVYRKRITDQLAASEARFRGLFENAVIGLILSGPDDEVIDTNRAMLGMVGSQARKAPEPAPIDPRIREIARIEPSAKPVEHAITTATGERRILEITSARIPKGPTSDALTARFVQDVTELRRYQRELEERQRGLRTLFLNEESIREQERTRLSRDLHDVLGQMLTALKMDLHWLGSHTTDDATATGAKEMIGQVDEMIVFTKKVCSQLRDNVLDVFGFEVALDEHLSQFQTRTGISVDRRYDCSSHGLARDVEVSLLRIIQESLTNVTRHAHATTVTVECGRTTTGVVWRVRDDGVGFDPASSRPAGSLGLIGMNERAAAWGGRVTIVSAPGNGTAVEVEVPCLERGE
ncbi:MAG: response regulator [Spirochaetaceae bacterium]|nr:MAG: response regulator [Spirochaetaceae bacterium]